MTEVVYDLSKQIASFNFFQWLAVQASAGATKVLINASVIKTDKWPLKTVRRRVESIIRPGPALYGLPSEDTTMGTQHLLRFSIENDLVRACKGGLALRRLCSVYPAGAARYTVTLRNTGRGPARNSNVDAWMKFAQKIGAVTIPDYEDAPIHLHERVALYAGARMNFFVSNGPSMLCFLSEYPAVQFGADTGYMRKLGCDDGRYPFMLPQHDIAFERDDLDVLERYYEEHSASW